MSAFGWVRAAYTIPPTPPPNHPHRPRPSLGRRKKIRHLPHNELIKHAVQLCNITVIPPQLSATLPHPPPPFEVLLHSLMAFRRPSACRNQRTAAQKLYLLFTIRVGANCESWLMDLIFLISFVYAYVCGEVERGATLPCGGISCSCGLDTGFTAAIRNKLDLCGLGHLSSHFPLSFLTTQERAQEDDQCLGHGFLVPRHCLNTHLVQVLGECGTSFPVLKCLMRKKWVGTHTQKKILYDTSF